MSNFTCYVGEQIKKITEKTGKMTLQDLARCHPLKVRATVLQ